MKDNLGRGDVAFARNGFAEGAQNGQRVRVRSPVGAPDNWAVRDVLTKERVQVGPIVLVFGLNPGKGAVSTSLTSVRGADGDIQGSVGVAQGRGEDVCGPQVGAKDETGNLHFSSVITLLRCCMQKGRDGIVSPCGLPKGAAGGIGCALRNHVTQNAVAKFPPPPNPVASPEHGCRGERETRGSGDVRTIQRVQLPPPRPLRYHRISRRCC